MAKFNFCPYILNQMLLFPQQIDKDIAPNDPVRLLDVLVDNLDLTNVYQLYNADGRNPYHPKMLLKVVLYAYMNNIYSCRRMERLLLRDIHFVWLAGYEQPCFATINRFRNRLQYEIDNIFTQIILILSEKGFLSLETAYIDGTKIESKANKYTFVWRKSVEFNRAKLLKKIEVLLSQIDDVIAQDNAAQEEVIETTRRTITTFAQWVSI